MAINRITTIEVRNMIDKIQWLGHGSFVIEGPPIIYINPWRVTSRTFHPDVILVGHDHYEHFSLADIKKLRGSDTIVVSNEAVADQIDSCMILRPWQSVTIDSASIKAIPAYSPEDLRHPIEAGGIGFIISMNLYDIYYAGDTQAIPEMDYIHPDIALLPIDGNGTLTPESAADIVGKIRPRWAIPYNFGALPDGANSHDAQSFKNAVAERAKVIIPNKMA
jgi:L-ascorbate metabolism protein UlaG (beta-lactamase superfamily)